MAKKNDDFFKEKKDWSEVKDSLLGCYLRPYFQKILYTNHPVVYIDGFAGKGKFDDGQLGSPLIAQNIIAECLNSTHKAQGKVETNFIELNHADELEANLDGSLHSTVHRGRFEEKIIDILRTKRGYNVFLYIDPYGIKSLDYGLFEKIMKGNYFYSAELLINLNTFGFIRNGCKVLGINFEDDVEVFGDLVEYNQTKLDACMKSVELLNKIAGGVYWEEIISLKKDNKIDIYQAEDMFTQAYCRNLQKQFKYVLNMPIRLKKGKLPKYRMIHATNHADGCILMADNICERWELMKDIQSGGQIKMWDENLNEEVVEQEDILRIFENQLKEKEEFSHLNPALAEFYSENGAICKSGKLTSALKILEKEGKIQVRRTPEFTKTGKPSMFYSDSKGKETELRWLT